VAEIDKEKLRRAIVNRGMVVPIVEYDDGTQDWGVPGLLMEPIEAWKRLQAGASDNVARMQQGLPFDPQSAGDAFAVTGAAAMGSAVPQAARMVGRQTRPAQTAARYADDALTMEEVSPGQGFGSGAGTPATNWTPFSRAYPRAEDSPTWPQSWGETASAAEKAAFAEREYLHNLWREQMNARWSPDWDRPIVEREVMDAYPGLGEAMRRADATFQSIRKGTPQGADPWASDPYAWFNRPHELGSPDLTEADVAAHVAKSKPIGAYVTSGAREIDRQYANQNPRINQTIQFNANPKEVAALGAALTGERHGMRSALADDKLIAIVKKYGIAGAASLYGVSELDLMEAMQEQGL
jgi:hypothetical protein